MRLWLPVLLALLLSPIVGLLLATWREKVPVDAPVTPPAPAEVVPATPARMPVRARSDYPAPKAWMEATKWADVPTDLAMGWAWPGAEDGLLDRRAGSLVRRLDHVAWETTTGLGQHCRHPYDSHLTCGTGLPEPPAPAIARARLRVALCNDFDKVVSHAECPSVPDVAAGLLTRGLLLLPEFGNDPASVQLLEEHLEDSHERVRAAAAFGLAKLGRSGAAVAILSSKPRGETFRALVAAMARGRWIVTKQEDERVIVGRSRELRELDDVLMAAAAEDVDGLLAGALAGRVDNPALRERLLEIVAVTSDPSVVRGVVRVRPDIAAEPRYVAAIKRWAASKDPALRLWALRAMAEVSDAEIPALLLRMIKQDQRGPAVFFSAALKRNPSSNRRLTEELEGYIRWYLACGQ